MSYAVELAKKLEEKNREIEALRAQLADAHAREGALRDALKKTAWALQSKMDLMSIGDWNFVNNALSSPSPAAERVGRLEAIAEAAKNCRKACKDVFDDAQSEIYVYEGDNTLLDISDAAIKALDKALAGGECE